MIVVAHSIFHIISHIFLPLLFLLLCIWSQFILICAREHGTSILLIDSLLISHMCRSRQWDKNKSSLLLYLLYLQQNNYKLCDVKISVQSCKSGSKFCSKETGQKLNETNSSLKWSMHTLICALASFQISVKSYHNNMRRVHSFDYWICCNANQ